MIKLLQKQNGAICYASQCKTVISDCYIGKVVARHAILHDHVTSPMGRSASYRGLRYKFDINRLLDDRFDYCNLVWNDYCPTCSLNC